MPRSGSSVPSSRLALAQPYQSSCQWSPIGQLTLRFGSSYLGLKVLFTLLQADISLCLTRHFTHVTLTSPCLLSHQSTSTAFLVCASLLTLTCTDASSKGSAKTRRPLCLERENKWDKREIAIAIGLVIKSFNYHYYIQMSPSCQQATAILVQPSMCRPGLY